jgi:hypothetical protein
VTQFEALVIKHPVSERGIGDVRDYLAPEKVESGSENIRRVKAEMYCEELKFDYEATWA